MKQFLLLRSNKQSGPYSAEDLKQMGLKPYDLIWVEGKSAAWRYPGEVEELKSFAPAVEEQPYDRFYKKSDTAAKNQQSTPDTTTQIQPAVQQPEKAPIKKEKEYKRVFVTLPATAGNGYNSNSNGNGNGNGYANTNANAAPAPNMPVEKPAVPVTEKKQEYSQYMPKEKTPEPTPDAYIPVNDQPQAEPTPVRNEPAPVKKQPVYQQKNITRDELPEEVYFPRKKSSRFKPPVVAVLAAAMVAMVALGIWIGVSINAKDKGVSLIKNVDRVPTNNTNQNEGGLIGPTESNNQPVIFPDSTAEIKQPVLSTQTKKPVRIPTPSSVILSKDSIKQGTASNENKDTGNVSDEQIPVKKPVSKPTMPELEKMVSVSNNDYKVGPFGGISKLELTVTNSSDYALNLVVVQVEYLKVNKEVFKTENLYFRDMSANSSLTLDAPRSNRGNSINYKVTLINSKDHIFHAGN